MNVKFSIVLVLYMIFIFWISIQPVPENTKELFPYQDKVVHFVLYTLLATIGYLTLHRSQTRYTNLILWLLPIIIASFYGGFIEFCQLFVPTRSFETNDIIVNCFGGITGSTLMQILTRTR